jgi:hypothetical protein
MRTALDRLPLAKRQELEVVVRNLFGEVEDGWLVERVTILQ